jgi:hypothetical protein
MFISEHITKFNSTISLQERDDMKKRWETFVKNYIEPTKSSTGKTLTKRSEVDPEKWETFSLPEGL